MSQEEIYVIKNLAILALSSLAINLQRRAECAPDQAFLALYTTVLNALLLIFSYYMLPLLTSY